MDYGYRSDDAMRWLLATAIGRRLGREYRLSAWAPKDGFYDCLLLHTTELTVRPSVAFNRKGQVVVLHGEDATTVAHDPWPLLAAGQLSVVELAERTWAIMSRLGEDVHGSGATGSAQNRLLAEIGRVSALFNLGWSIAHGRRWTQLSESALSPSPHTLESRHIEQGLFSSVPALQRLIGDSHARAAEVWFVCDADGQPIAAVDGEAAVHLLVPTGPAFDDVTIVPLGDVVDDALERPWQVVSDLFGSLIATTATQQTARRPGLGIPAALEAFNRKERGLLFAAATGAAEDREAHGPSLTVAPWWADQLSRVDGLGWQVPKWAWMAVDYHLSWLHGALSWSAGVAWPGQQDDFPPVRSNFGDMVTGNQEDADVLLCWTDQSVVRLLLIEAKGYGAWGNKQMTSKLRRLTAILTDATGNGVPLELRVVLASRTRPQKLDTTAWPDFALHQPGKPYWTRLPASGMRIATQRVGQLGTASAAGNAWRISGPTR